MKTTLESNRPLEPGVALLISERDENGTLVGYYKGYWNSDKCRVDLYPTHNPYCWWRVPRVKHSVSEFIIKIAGPVRTVGTTGAPIKKEEKKKPAELTKGIKGQTAAAMKEITGQKKFEF